MLGGVNSDQQKGMNVGHGRKEGKCMIQVCRRDSDYASWSRMYTPLFMPVPTRILSPAGSSGLKLLSEVNACIQFTPTHCFGTFH